MSSLSRRYRGARPDAGEFMPPNPRTFGATTFGKPQVVRLAAWLREAGWPREHMDIVELENDKPSVKDIVEAIKKSLPKEK